MEHPSESEKPLVNISSLDKPQRFGHGILLSLKNQHTPLCNIINRSAHQSVIPMGFSHLVAKGKGTYSQKTGRGSGGGGGKEGGRAMI